MTSSTQQHAPLAAQNSEYVTRTCPSDASETRHDVWGFADTRFEVDELGCVTLTGNRYALCGHKLPYLLPWVEKTMGIEVPLQDRHISKYPPCVPASRLSDSVQQQLVALLGDAHVSVQDDNRLRHGHGHTQEEMYAIKYGKLSRVPDVVVYPDSEADLEALVALALEQGCVLVPYGGGTNVTEALRCSEFEQRTIISVDMARMDRIMWIDPVNRMARIEAGAVGRHLQAALAERGYTIGHEPDSIEFSTLGGWVATHASGMKKNRYGNIEDVVLDVNVVTADGVVSRSDQVAPRESTGGDARRFLFGSEGSLGIVSSAVVKLFALPEVQAYGSLIFPAFADGVAFLYELNQSGEVPASVRLVDNLQFQLSMALKSERQGLAALKSRAEKLFVTKVRGFDPNQMVACTLVFEGRADEVSRQRKEVMRLARKHRGLWGGAENGSRGYQMTYGIAYIRDFVMNHYILAESFETSVPWSHAQQLCERVKRRIQAEHQERKLPGKPLVTCRITQLYDTGVAIYFYYAYFFRGVENPSAVYAEIESCARDEILSAGGSLSHHHGVGHLRRRFLPRIMSPAALAMRQQTKHALDPHQIFGTDFRAVHP